MCVGRLPVAVIIAFNIRVFVWGGIHYNNVMSWRVWALA